jgi:menaquinone-dependent protoporphyrinogen oxidase
MTPWWWLRRCTPAGISIPWSGGSNGTWRRWGAKPAAFVSVCLGVLQHDAKVQHDLQTMVDEFVASTGWRPSVVKFVAGALPYTKYGWLQRLVMKRIVAKAGGDTDTSRDYEYTDWNDLRHFAAEFGCSGLQPLDPGRPSPK